MVKLLRERNKNNGDAPIEITDSNSEERNRSEGNGSSEGNAIPLGPGPTAMSSNQSLPVQQDDLAPVSDEQTAPEPTPATDEQKAPEVTPGATTSTTTDEKSASAVEFNKEEIEKFIASRRMQKEDKKQSENFELELSHSEVKTLVQLIACEMCGKIPFPDCRYYCESGHIYCYHCMIEQSKSNQGTCSVRILGKEYKIQRELEDLVAANCEWMDDKEKMRLPEDDDLSNALIRCGGKISYSFDHPLVNHLFNSIVWNCPMKKLGCYAAVPGENLPRHIMKCLKLRIMKCP